MEDLRFWLEYEGIDKVAVNPLIKDEFGIKYKQLPNQYFFREDINSDLKFLRRDYNLINNAPLETEFIVTIDEKNGSVWTTMYIGTFTRFDCICDPTLKQFTLSPDSKDNYRELIAKKDTEVNIIDLALPKRDVTYYKSSILQMYMPGSSYATNVYQGDIVENIFVTNGTNDLNVLQDYGFGNQLGNFGTHFIPGTQEIKGYYFAGKSLSPANRFKLVILGRITNDGTEYAEDPTNYGIALDPYYVGFQVTASTLNPETHYGTTFTDAGIPFTYLGRWVDPSGMTLEMFKRQGTTGPNGGYPPGLLTLTGAITVTYTTWQIIDSADISQYDKYIRWGIYDTTPSSGSARVTWIGQCATNYAYYTGDYTPQFTYGTTFKRVSLLTDTARWFFGLVVARILTNQAQIYYPSFPTLVTCDEVGQEDLTDHGYKYSYPVYLEDYLQAKDDAVADDAYFGKFHQDSINTPGQYFKAFPTLLPVNETDWTSVAWWVTKPPGTNLTSFGEQLTMHDGYLLADIISGVLSKVSPGITFSATETHSKFLYGAVNPLTGETMRSILFTPKSNILKPGYDQPASQGKIKWSDIEVFLLTMDCYWFVDSSKRLRIEHSKYFEYGGSYTDKQVGTNLTQLFDNTNNRLLSEGLTHSYEKNEIPEKIRVKWMDDVSRHFDKAEIVCSSKFRTIGKEDEIRCGNITTDLMFAQSSPGGISKDGFFAMYAARHSSNFNLYVVQFMLVNCYDLRTRSLNNGFFSAAYLLYWFHNINLPSLNCTVNNYENGNFALQTVRKTKKQDITYPVKIIDLLKLVETDLGQGRIKEALYTFFDKSLKATILHEP